MSQSIDKTLDDPSTVRRAARTGALVTTTAGLARGFVQGNVAILPRAFATDFHAFCTNNPKPCPVIGIAQDGATALPALGEDIDIRTDVPRYRVFRDGQCIDEPHDLMRYWRDDLVTFVLGCSFSFEEALLDSGIALRHIAQGKNVAMWRTSIPTMPAGPFTGPLVVSMRPIRSTDVDKAVAVTSRFPSVHGAPVHVGDPAAIGIDDLSRPDYGDATDLLPGEVPVFWACGVTPQAVIVAARPSLAITHAPGCMLVTDLRNESLARPDAGLR